jgi:phosphomannomutase
MIEHEAVLGGEGSGGSVPEVSTHDSAAAIGLILSYLAQNNRPISQLVEELPDVVMLKYNIEVEPNHLYSVLQNFRVLVESENLNTDLSDGIKIQFNDGWVHVRAEY